MAQLSKRFVKLTQFGCHCPSIVLCLGQHGKQLTYLVRLALLHSDRKALYQFGNCLPRIAPEGRVTPGGMVVEHVELLKDNFEPSFKWKKGSSNSLSLLRL